MKQLFSLLVDGFRSIDREIEVRLDAPVVLIHGHNGAGKTSLLSAIELALTGAIPSLNRVDPKYRNELLNYRMKKGRIEVQLKGEGLPDTIRIDLAKGTPRSEPGLPSDLARFYSERCYLAQSTLSQLLAIYGTDERGTGTHLSRFAAELLELDRLDALQNGLHPARDRRNVRQLAPTFSTLEKQQESIALNLETIERRLHELTKDLSGAEEELRSQLTTAGLEGQEINDSSARALQEAMSAAEDGLRRADELRRAAQRIDRMIADTRREILIKNVEQALDGARQWHDSEGARITRLLTNAAERVAGVPSTISTAIGEDIRRVRLRLDQEADRLDKAVQAGRSAAARKRQIEDELTRLRSALVETERRLENVASDGSGLAQALAVAEPHIVGEDCPVCQRDFSEVSDEPLTDFVRRRIEALTDAADSLRRDSEARLKLISQISDLEGEQAALEQRALGKAELLQLDASAKTVRELAQEAALLVASADEGARKLEAHLAATSRLEGWTQADAERQVLLDDVSGLERQAGVPEDLRKGDIEKRIEACNAIFEDRLTNARLQLSAWRRASELSDNIARLRQEIEKETKLRKEILARQSQHDDAMKVVRDIRSTARRVEEAAAATRAKVVAQVFNERLNRLWRDLFVRLAPDEPFVPSFDVSASVSDRIRPTLKTIYRTGEEAGAPGVMLSSGNLNTAALTLFMALHLAVQPKLPWLVLDDPVQSMDDVHKANFASLLRTLAKEHHRQIFIAVHDRPLFDYLALELAPAFKTDQLITIELERAADGKLEYDTRRMGYIERPKILHAA